MLAGRKLVLDTMSEIYSFLRTRGDAEFWNFCDHDPIPDSIYVLGRKQVTDNLDKFQAMARDPRYCMVFDNSAEGSSTLASHLQVHGLESQVFDQKILLISGGDLDDRYPYLLYDHFLVQVLNYEENILAQTRTSEIFSKSDKPYKFLFLNGRARPHRKYLWERLRLNGLLDQSLWTMLDRGRGSNLFKLVEDGVDIMSKPNPLRNLPREYEVYRYKKSADIDLVNSQRFIKFDMFNDEWGDIYIEPKPYIDTYFSLVTETVIDYPYSFRTEKIAKPLAIGHPWICATNRGFYRDIRHLGFQTFAGIIDESFDMIDDNQQRMDRVVDIVTDLCQQDLSGFLAACEPICKYNQQHLRETVFKIKSGFTEQFTNFIKQSIS